MKAKILTAVAISLAIVILVTLKTCNCNKPVPLDPYKERVKNLEDSISKLNDTIMAGKVREAHLEVQYNKESTRADSLAKATQKTIIRYREVRGRTDTVAIIVAADSLVLKAEELAKQVPILKQAADSLINQGKELQQLLSEKSAAYQELSATHESQVQVIEKDRDYWKKLAKVRGAKIEWFSRLR